ncbi:hypothetical protein NPX13_g370 [Xylaria arbuscula]|uniref:Uncharacterized protein n=1 Tax=Xylaria arbuscula TaxID=114810 RepID=A0A9W8TS33_9PEZI|nr:hypothetical protein NPX13_g370 [Xylaria arbuscula]
MVEDDRRCFKHAPEPPMQRRGPEGYLPLGITQSDQQKEIHVEPRDTELAGGAAGAAAAAWSCHASRPPLTYSVLCCILLAGGVSTRASAGRDDPKTPGWETGDSGRNNQQ